MNVFQLCIFIHQSQMHNTNGNGYMEKVQRKSQLAGTDEFPLCLTAMHQVPFHLNVVQQFREIQVSVKV